MPTRLLSFNDKLLNEVKFANAGEIVPESFCLDKLTEVTFFPEESQLTKLQLSQALFPCQDSANDIGYPTAPATSRSAVTCGSHGPGLGEQKLLEVISEVTLEPNTGNGPCNLLFRREIFDNWGRDISDGGTIPVN